MSAMHSVVGVRLVMMITRVGGSDYCIRYHDRDGFTLAELMQLIDDHSCDYLPEQLRER